MTKQVDLCNRGRSNKRLSDIYFFSDFDPIQLSGK